MWNFSWKNMGFMLLSSSAWRAWVLRNSENFGVNLSLWSCLQCPALVTNQAFWSLDAGKWLMFSTWELSSFVLWRPIFFSIWDSTGVLRAGGEERMVVITKYRSTFCQLYYCFKIIYSLHTFFFFLSHPFCLFRGQSVLPALSSYIEIPWWKCEELPRDRGLRAALILPLTSSTHCTFHESASILFHIIDLSY